MITLSSESLSYLKFFSWFDWNSTFYLPHLFWNLFLCLENLLVFIVSIFYIEVPPCTFYLKFVWWNFILTPDHIELFKSELFAIIIHTVSSLGQFYGGFFYYWNLFLMMKCWRISVSRFWADFASFWRTFLACFNVIVWCLLLRSGLNFFVLQASTGFTHSFGFGFLISFLKWNLVPSEVFIFLFLIFCIFVSFWCGIHSAFWWWFWCTFGLCPMTFCFMQ